MHRRTDISVILVSYNVKQYLQQALDSIFKALSGLSHEVFVVDNGSGDASAAMVRHRFSRVRLIENTENVGFAKANNQALVLAKGRAVCLINPDTLVREDTFKVCLNYLDAHPDVGAVGCMILNPDGSLQPSCRRSFPTPWVAFTKVFGLSRLFPKSRLFGRYNLTYLDPGRTSEVEALSGSFMVVRKEAMDQAGILDEAFFMYGEDLDWCTRIREKGWKIVYHPATRIVHYKGRSTQEASFDNLRLFYGAMGLFVRKHFKRGWSFLPRWFLMAGIGLRGMVSFVSRLLRRLTVPIVDLVLMQASLVLALLIRFGGLDYYGPRYGPVDAAYSLVWLACLFLLGLYEKGCYSAFKAALAVGIGLILNTSLTFFFPRYAFSRQVVLMAGCFDVLFLSGWRLGIRFFSRMRRFPFLGTVGRILVRRRAAVVGTGKASRRVAERLIREIGAGYDLVGFIASDEKELNRAGGQPAPVLGSLRDLARICRAHNVRSVIFPSDSVDYGRILHAVAESKALGVEFKMVPRDVDVLVGKTNIDSLEAMPLVDLDYRFYYGPNRFLKRGTDVLVPLFLSPLILAAHVWLGLVQSVRFERIWIQDGFGGRTSIRRLTRKGEPLAGAAVRLVLLWEVLLGRISLVGDEIVIPNRQADGIGIKPGLTGLVQVNADRHLSKEDKVTYRMFYLRNYSPLLDVEIVLRALFR